VNYTACTHSPPWNFWNISKIFHKIFRELFHAKKFLVILIMHVVLVASEGPARLGDIVCCHSGSRLLSALQQPGLYCYNWVLEKVKGVYSSLREPVSELQGVTCHVGSHSVTCHPTVLARHSKGPPFRRATIPRGSRPINPTNTVILGLGLGLGLVLGLGLGLDC